MRRKDGLQHASTREVPLMKRKPVLLIASTAALLALVAVAGPKKPEGLLVLEWAGKAKAEAPPVAVLLEMGAKDTAAKDWSGRATVTGAKVVHREGYRFR